MEPPDDLPRSPSGRLPQWVIDERAAGPAPDPAGRGGPGSPTRRGGRRPRRSILPGLLLVGLLAVGSGAGYLLLGGRSLPAALSSAGGTPGPAVPPRADPAPGAPTEPAGGADLQGKPDAVRSPSAVTADPRAGSFDTPTPGRESAAQPLGAPAPVTGRSRSYSFLAKQADGSPVGYDPCRPIHYVVRPNQAPKGGQALITEAVARVARATGLRFVYDGSTTELPSQERSAYQPDRYGDRWAPLLIAWRTGKQYAGLKSDVVGEGGSVSVRYEGRPTVYVSGQIVLDSEEFPQVLRQPGGRAEARVTVMHELGHVVGLGHVDDRTQVMYQRSSPGVVDFAAGDLTGLAALGRGACAPWV